MKPMVRIKVCLSDSASDCIIRVTKLVFEVKRRRPKIQVVIDFD